MHKRWFPFADLHTKAPGTDCVPHGARERRGAGPESVCPGGKTSTAEEKQAALTINLLYIYYILYDSLARCAGGVLTRGGYSYSFHTCQEVGQSWRWESPQVARVPEESPPS
jgi:hypothetical protein